ncbi:MAG: hypothetical protein M3495_15635 [Pseudomonadota bacterium]|nr:hypothetical protein [Gammaproteobacteria bacterium]MDQ3582934.1 hypothetical protein [Pseudomonadota bacterium]
MDTNPACQPFDLANNELLWHRPVPAMPGHPPAHRAVEPEAAPHVFQAVCGAMQQAAEKLPAHLPCEVPRQSCQDIRH